MAIHKVKIRNFKCFKGLFELELNRGLNILVGNNETGKSTILDAITLSLYGKIERSKQNIDFVNIKRHKNIFFY